MLIKSEYNNGYLLFEQSIHLGAGSKSVAAQTERPFTTTHLPFRGRPFPRLDRQLAAWPSVLGAAGPRPFPAAAEHLPQTLLGEREPPELPEHVVRTCSRTVQLQEQLLTTFLAQEPAAPCRRQLHRK